jgi:hypothetical protein
MKKLFYLLGLSITVFLAACDKDDTPDPTVSFTANLTGAQEETPTGSAATGTAVGTYDKNTKVLTLTVTYTGLTPTAGHIHKGAVGVSGPVIFPFVAPLDSPISFTSDQLDSGQEADLLGGNYYVNLHTVAFGGGEIRGQLVQN